MENQEKDTIPLKEWEWDEESERDARDYKKETNEVHSESYSLGLVGNDASDCNGRSLTNFLSVDGGAERRQPFRLSVVHSENNTASSDFELCCDLKRADRFCPADTHWDSHSIFKDSIFESTERLHSSDEDTVMVDDRKDARPDSESSIIKESLRPLTPEPVDLIDEQKSRNKKQHKALPTTVRVFKTNVDRDPYNVNDDIKV